MPADIVFDCPHCPKIFTRKGDFNRHMAIHTGLRPHVCSFCGKGFSQRSGLNTHINTHTGDKPFRCKIPSCNRSFGDPSSRTRHLHEVHRSKGAFVCYVAGCSSQIKRRSAFAKHLKDHGLIPSKEVVSKAFREDAPGRRTVTSTGGLDSEISREPTKAQVYHPPTPARHQAYQQPHPGPYQTTLPYPIQLPSVTMQHPIAPTTYSEHELRQLEHILYSQPFFDSPAVPVLDTEGLLFMDQGHASNYATPAHHYAPLPIASTSTSANEEYRPATPPLQEYYGVPNYPETPALSSSASTTPTSTPPSAASLLTTPQFVADDALPDFKLNGGAEVGKVLFREFYQTPAAPDSFVDDAQWFSTPALYPSI